MTPQETAARITQLADLLERVPDEHFDMDTIVNGEPERLRAIAAGTAKGCGAVACAMGYLPCLWPDEVKWDGHGICRVGQVIGYPATSFSEAAEVLGLTGIESLRLFDPMEYTDDEEEPVPRSDVIARLREFAEEKSGQGAALRGER